MWNDLKYILGLEEIWDNGWIFGQGEMRSMLHKRPGEIQAHDEN